MPRYFILYKPYGMLSQFTKEAAHHRSLSDLDAFPPEVYPVGRLDKDSEGLLLLTDDKQLNERLLHPRNRHRRTYWVEVEKIPDQQALQQLREGMVIRINKKEYTTLPAEIRLMETPPPLPPRDPPVRFRKNIPTAWLEITLTEGKNRQVRRMCAAAGYPTLRLVRVAIEDLQLGDLLPGEVLEMDREKFFQKIFKTNK